MRHKRSLGGANLTQCERMFRALMVLGCAGVVAGCSADQTALSLTASPRSLVADGSSTSTVTVDAVGASGLAGAGTVSLKASTGALKDATLTLTDGSAKTTYTCQTSCGVSATLTASWSTGGRTVTAETVISFYVPSDAGTARTDAGLTDAGANPVDAGLPPFDAGGGWAPEAVVLFGPVGDEHQLGWQNLVGGEVALGLTVVPDDLVSTRRGLVYRTGPTVHVAVFDAPTPVDDGGWAFPSAPEANDVPVTVTCPDGGLTGMRAGLDDELWLLCQNNEVRLVPGDIRYPLQAGDAFLAGSGGVAMVRRDGGVVLQASSGAVVKFGGPPGVAAPAIRATATGFDFTYEADGGCRLGHATHAGQFTDMGQLALLSPTYALGPNDCMQSRVEPGGTSVVLPLRRVVDDTWLLVRRGLITVGTQTVFTASTTASDWSTATPQLFLQSTDAGLGVLVRQ